MNTETLRLVSELVPTINSVMVDVGRNGFDIWFDNVKQRWGAYVIDSCTPVFLSHDNYGLRRLYLRDDDALIYTDTVYGRAVWKALLNNCLFSEGRPLY